MPGELGRRVGRAASNPGPPWKYTRNGRSRSVGVGELAGEHGDPLAGRVAVVERDVERVLDRDQSGQEHLVGLCVSSPQ